MEILKIVFVDISPVWGWIVLGVAAALSVTKMVCTCARFNSEAAVRQ